MENDFLIYLLQNCCYYIHAFSDYFQDSWFKIQIFSQDVKVPLDSVWQKNNSSNVNQKILAITNNIINTAIQKPLQHSDDSVVFVNVHTDPAMWTESETFSFVSRYAVSCFRSAVLWIDGWMDGWIDGVSACCNESNCSPQQH